MDWFCILYLFDCVAVGNFEKGNFEIGAIWGQGAIWGTREGQFGESLIPGYMGGRWPLSARLGWVVDWLFCII